MATTRRAALTAAAQEYLLAFRSHSDDEGVTPSLVAKDLEVSNRRPLRCSADSPMTD